MKTFMTLTNERGLALFIALMLTLMLSVIGIALVSTTNDEIAIAGNEYNEMRTFYAAEAGLDRAVAAIQTSYEATGLPPATMPGTTFHINNISVTYAASQGTATQKTLTKGSMAGLKASVTPYTVTTVAYDSSQNTAMTLEEQFEISLVPIFQFSVFYDTDLEIAPGPATILLGRMHSNRNVYIQAGSELDIDSYFTAFGKIRHGRKPGSGMSVDNGDVRIKGLDGDFHNMEMADGTWLDADDAYWFDSAMAIWEGRVQDSAFGQDQINLPLFDPTGDNHKLIEPAVDPVTGNPNHDSYENKATFKIVDGTAYQYNVAFSTWVDVTALLVASGAMTESNFKDKRENKDVTVVDIDMSVFKDSPYFPSNGIMYNSDSRSGLHGLRIHSADDIGHPLTIASENPVYTKGDVNRITKQPMSIISDALYVLSDNWNDDPAVSGSNFKTDRPAANTIVNFSYITGNMETGVGPNGYNGGLENLMRLLEDWTGRTLTFRGSIVNLWEAQQVDGVWSGTYYSPPNRNWAFDPDLSDMSLLPPGTPNVRAFVRMGWKQDNVGLAFQETNTDMTIP